METVLTHSDPPRRDRRRAGSSLTGQLVGNEIRDVVFLATLLDILAESLEELVASLAKAGLEERFEPVADHDSKATLHFMLQPDSRDIILDIEVTSWIYELEEREFHKLLFEVMKPAFLQIFADYTFDTITSDPDKWFEMMSFGAILLHKQTRR